MAEIGHKEAEVLGVSLPSQPEIDSPLEFPHVEFHVVDVIEIFIVLQNASRQKSEAQGIQLSGLIGS